MAKIKPEYQDLPEFVEILSKIVDLYPDVFPSVEPQTVAAVQIVNKPRPESRNHVWDLKAIGAPITLFCPIRYFVIVYSSDWEIFDEEHKAAVVADVLFTISPEGEGKTIPFDKKDHSVILRTLGVDYMNETVIPNILGGNLKWKT